MRPLWLALGWGLVAAIVWLSLTPSPPKVDFEQGDKVGHFLAYGRLMFWFCSSISAQRTRLAYAAGFVAMGVGLEFVQGWTGYRSFEVDRHGRERASACCSAGAARSAPFCAKLNAVNPRTERLLAAPIVPTLAAPVGAGRAAGRVPVDGVGRRHLLRRPPRHRAARRPRAGVPAHHAAADDLRRRDGRRRLFGHRARPRRGRPAGGARAWWCTRSSSPRAWAAAFTVLVLLLRPRDLRAARRQGRDARATRSRYSNMVFAGAITVWIANTLSSVLRGTRQHAGAGARP